jgi:hypothetical protein
MKSHIILFISLLYVGATYSQVNCDKFKANYIPKNLDEAISFLDCKWSEKDKEDFKSKEEGAAVAGLHLGTAMAIRNNWGLWREKKTPLVKFFNKKGIYHPDNMTGIIFTSFHRKLNNKPIDLEKQIEYYTYSIKKSKARSDSMKILTDIKLEKELETYKIGDTVMIGFKVGYQDNKVWFRSLAPFENADCYLSGIVSGKQKKTKFLSLTIIKLGGYKEVYYRAKDVKLKIGKTYDIFSLSGFKLIRNINQVTQ